jgi:hypothetical protein
LIPSFPNFRKWSSQLNSMTMSKRWTKMWTR